MDSALHAGATYSVAKDIPNQLTLTIQRVAFRGFLQQLIGHYIAGR
jgi:hypothetical protein